MSRTLWLVSPLYFDVESYLQVRTNVGKALESHPPGQAFDLRFLAVDDSGGADRDVERLRSDTRQRVMTVPFPLGHQRAIVYGLRQLSDRIEEDDVVVTLDGDGEDKPEDLPRLLDALLASDTGLRTVVVAARTRRRESLLFKLLYLAFKNAFLLLTGTIIRSGNYAAVRGWFTHQIVFHPHFDLCYSSSLLSLGLNVRRVPCERGARYAGRSKMTFLKLLAHGLRMLMPFADRIAVRGLVLFSGLFTIGVALAVWVAAVRFRAESTLPGWATSTLSAALLLCTTAIASLLLVFTLFVQSQSLSMSRLDTRHPLDGPARAPPHQPE